MEEKELIKSLQNAKTKNKAFEVLVAQYQQKIYWHIRRIVLSHDDADDLLQETFIKIFQNIEKFKGESSLFSWIYRIATNLSLDFLKKKAQQKHCSVEEIQTERSQHLHADVYFEGNALEIAFQKAISQLPEKQQLVFKMKYFEELSYAQISEILNTSEGALKASYHIACEKIKKILQSD